MHANGGHDQLDGLRLNACIAWKSCQHKIWTGLSSTGPWPSATCTGHAGSSFLGHVNTYHRTSPCALLWCSACMSNTLVRFATHKLCCCWLLVRSEVCLRCAGDRLQRLRLCVFQRASVCSMDLLHRTVHGSILRNIYRNSYQTKAFSQPKNTTKRTRGRGTPTLAGRTNRSLTPALRGAISDEVTALTL